MSKKILKKLATSALSEIQNGKMYRTSYVVDRLEDASRKHPTDATINYTCDFFKKHASSNAFTSQKEVGEIYDRLVGFSGERNFRFELEDLLPPSRQYVKVAHTPSRLRTETGSVVELTHVNHDLADAFTALFGLGKDSLASASKITPESGVKKVAYSTLASIGGAPDEIVINAENEHFVLCSALYQTGGFNKAAVQVVVPTFNGLARIPEKIIVGGTVTPLNRENLFLAIKEAKFIRKSAGASNVAALRSNSMVQPIQYKVPEALSEFADIEMTVIAAAKNHSPKKIAKIMHALDEELAGIGLNRAQLKLSEASSSNLLFDANITTSAGSFSIQIPVELTKTSMHLPTSFSMRTRDGKSRTFDFTSKGVSKFASSLEDNFESKAIARNSGSMSAMSSSQLRDVIIKSAAEKNYRAAEDAISLIESKYGFDQGRNANNLYSRMLQHFSKDHTTLRDKQVAAAVKSKDLIKRSNYAELFCPKLGLPLSKVAFDSKGRPIPFRRSVQSSLMKEESAKDNLSLVTKE